MREPITGLVARILNSRELVINRGTEHGVRKGAHFAVLDVTGEGIKDPETDEFLGSVQKTKVEVEVTQVGERIAVARTFRFSRINEGGAGLGVGGEVARIFAPPKYVKKFETLKIADASWEPLSEKDSLVEVGDPVAEILDTTADAPTSAVISPQS